MPFVYLAGPVGPDQNQTFTLAQDYGAIVKPFFSSNQDIWRSDNNCGALTEDAVLYLAFRNNPGQIEAVLTCTLGNATREVNWTTPLAENPDVLVNFSGRAPENVWGTVTQGTPLENQINNLYYPQCPKINMLTVICISTVEQTDDETLTALNTWYRLLNNYQSTVHELDANALDLE
jgi:hypothetical protein